MCTQLLKINAGNSLSVMYDDSERAGLTSVSKFVPRFFSVRTESILINICGTEWELLKYLIIWGDFECRTTCGADHTWIILARN